jgi:hypothetical protein
MQTTYDNTYSSLNDDQLLHWKSEEQKEEKRLKGLANYYTRSSSDLQVMSELGVFCTYPHQTALSNPGK